MAAKAVQVQIFHEDLLADSIDSKQLKELMECSVLVDDFIHILQDFVGDWSS